jgi:hypothetical protein
MKTEWPKAFEKYAYERSPAEEVLLHIHEQMNISYLWTRHALEHLTLVAEAIAENSQATDDEYIAAKYVIEELTEGYGTKSIVREDYSFSGGKL